MLHCYVKVIFTVAVLAQMAFLHKWLPCEGKVLACILSVIAAVAVAMPLIGCMKFAIRCATSTDRALPFTTPNLILT